MKFNHWNSDHFLPQFFLLTALAIGTSACGRKTPKVESNKAERKIRFYRHPMTPSIHSDVPAKDSMGMDYIPVYDDELGQSTGSVPGRATVTLTPEQETLSGAKPVKVEQRKLDREIQAPGRVIAGTEVSFQVFEQDLQYIKTGQSFRASLPSLSGAELKGQITSVENLLDPMTRTARVNGVIKNFTGTRLLAESTLNGTIQVSLGEVTAIPENAVMHTGSEDLVFVTDGKGSYVPTTVALGIKAQGFYEVRSGLSPGMLVSSGPNFLLDSESRIRASYDSQDH